MKNPSRWLKIAAIFIILFGVTSFSYKGNIFSFRDSILKYTADLEYMTYSYDDGQYGKFAGLDGKNILVIGDSQTAAIKWQIYFGRLINADVSTHAKGGIGMIAMVDGDKKPGSMDINALLPLSAKDVEDTDYIILMGLYNEMKTFANSPGKLYDIYPKDTTYSAKFNYTITRIKQELNNAGNLKCKVIVVAPHLFGKGPYIDKSAYEFPGISDTLKKLSNYNKVEFVDLRALSGIDSTNWSVYHNGGYIKKAPYPNNPDNLHLNIRGHMKVAVAISKWMSNKYFSQTSHKQFAR